jgi:hypothetical protein
MSYLRYFCLFVYIGVQHILYCVFVLLFFVLCTTYVGSFSGLYVFCLPLTFIQSNPRILITVVRTIKLV